MRYVDQLIEEIEATQRNAKKIIEKYHCDHALLAEEAEPSSGVRFGELTGLQKFIFPKEHLLDDQAIDRIVQALVALYHALGMNPLFHDGVSYRIRYSHLRDFCNQDVFLNPGIPVDVEFCDFSPSDCPYGVHCHAANLLHNSCLKVHKMPHAFVNWLAN